MLDMKEITKRLKDERKVQFLFGHKTKEELDDGTIRGLILSGDYREVGSSVMIQNKDSNTGLTAWRHAGINDLEFCTYVEQSKTETLGWSWKNIEEYAEDVITVCRRKFKKADIILCALFNENFSTMTGVVFTEHSMFLFSKGKFNCEVEYTQIKEVDYKEALVVITLSEDNVVELNCANESYSYKNHVKYMYNLIMDIKDRLA